METETLPKIDTEIKKIGMSMYLKVGLGILSLGIVGAGLFFGINIYETKNNCILNIDDNFIVHGNFTKPFMCVSLPPSKAPWDFGPARPEKPLILLYPLKSQEVQVELIYTPGFSATFPEYSEEKKGWSVTAYPDATLLDHITGQETYGLFWEGNAGDTQYDLSKGWIIKGSEVREFLYEKLTEIGLNTKEKSDFIMYWYPKLQEYPYVQITFAGNDYTQSAPLVITPKPDSLLRVFMVAKPLSAPMYLEPQKLTKFERKGFSVVEWGGMIVE